MNDVTIADIARTAGVSVSTVSRILNNKPDVAEATRQRVQAVIEELGFTPHAQAQRLAAGRSRAIALLFPDSQLSLMREEFILGAARAASDASYTFYLMASSVTRSQLASLCRSALTDGIILMEIHLSDWRVSYLKRLGFPFVMIGRCANNNGISFIDMDFENAIAQAVAHLADLCHRKVALLALSNEAYERGYGPAVRSRDSYARTCRRLGLPIIVAHSDDTRDQLVEATHKLLDRHPDLTAMISMHGDTTIGVYRALEQRGLRIHGGAVYAAVDGDRLSSIRVRLPGRSHVDRTAERLRRSGAHPPLTPAHPASKRRRAASAETRRPGLNPNRHKRRDAYSNALTCS